jgi:hypothetical protein
MSITTLMLLSLPAALTLFKLGALAFAGFWIAKNAFSPQGLLAPAAIHRRSPANIPHA